MMARGEKALLGFGVTENAKLRRSSLSKQEIVLLQCSSSSLFVSMTTSEVGYATQVRT